MDLNKLRDEVGEWSERNFGKQESWRPLLGIGEELGELQHAYLKRAQGIRVNEDHNAKLKDAIGDMLIYLANFAAIEKLELEQILGDTWNQVKQRNWNANKTNGITTIKPKEKHPRKARGRVSNSRARGSRSTG
jgi:NTP pyrophosphatase (non-canonical NTP hydrolase)